MESKIPSNSSPVISHDISLYLITYVKCSQMKPGGSQRNERIGVWARGGGSQFDMIDVRQGSGCISKCASFENHFNWMILDVISEL